jgi:hypothetical protein
VRVEFFDLWVQGERNLDEVSPIMRWLCLTMRIQGRWEFFGRDNRKCLGLNRPPQHDRVQLALQAADNFEWVMLC